MSNSDLPDMKPGEDTKDCILAVAAPLQKKTDMGTLQNCGKTAEDLIKEIATLEMQVVQLEQHLLKLYKKKFDKETKELLQSSSERFLSGDAKLNSSRHFADLQLSSARFYSEHYGLSDHSLIQNLGSKLKKGTQKWSEQKLLDSSINRTHSWPLPLPMLQVQNEGSGVISQCRDFDAPETPNWISEEMIKCISTIFCTLADPPRRSSSPAMDEFSPMWNDHSLGSHLENSFVEVKHISLNSEKLRDADDTLLRFRALVHRLDEVDPRKLKHMQKLAFWINVHNALVMHGLLVYGIPQNDLKRMSLVLKAAYSIGGQTVSAGIIQTCLLGCRQHCPGQWLRSLLCRTRKLRVTDPRRLFATDHAEPLLHFALCAGAHSDPAVRVYTPEMVYQELEMAKDEYIQLALRVHDEHKILLPKKIDFFAKDCGLNRPADFAELLEPFLPSSLRQNIMRNHKTKVWNNVHWIPHNSSFLYLFHKDLVP